MLHSFPTLQLSNSLPFLHLSSFISPLSSSYLSYWTSSLICCSYSTIPNTCPCRPAQLSCYSCLVLHNQVFTLLLPYSTIFHIFPLLFTFTFLCRPSPSTPSLSPFQQNQPIQLQDSILLGHLHLSNASKYL